MSNKLTTEEFIKDSSDRHTNYYTYKNSIYTHAHGKLLVTCPLHGDFSIAADAHKNGGRGCPKCKGLKLAAAKKKSLEQFKKDATDTHKETYDYSLVAYKNTNSPVQIICKIHGVFSQRPSDHIRGQGCPSCQKSGYSINKPGVLYVLQTENLVKIGITNRTAELRRKAINKSSGKYFITAMHLLFKDGRTPLVIEKILLSKLRNMYKSPVEVFSGSTECFYDVEYDGLISEILTIVNSLK